MIIVGLKSLVGRLNPYCTQSLEHAAGSCLSRTNYEITVEHLLTALLEDSRSDIPLILHQSGVDAGLLKRSLNQTIDDFRTGNGAKPVFSPLLLEMIQDAWLVTSVDLYETRVRSGAILIALLRRLRFFTSGSYADMLADLNIDGIISRFGDLSQGSVEAQAQHAGRPAEAHAGSGADGSAGDGALGRFCIDFTAKAQAGEIDPVFGRDQEIRQMIDILARRRKNNPIAVGEAGVGKTAVVEGLALRIVERDVPEFLHDVSVLGLDMGLLEAGAGVKGEFENRLKSVISEIKASPKPIILFIDEAHTLIGAGGSAGGSDAANLLKPALARGELRTIAATTWSEYKKYFEKDPALARRFQLVKLDQPSVTTAVGILRGLKEKYEQVHGVTVRDDAVEAAADLSARYITGRQLPDKAVDLLDTSAARVKIGLTAKPDSVDDRERRLQALGREKEAFLRDQSNGREIDTARIGEIDEESKKLEAEIDELKQRWSSEKEAADQVLAMRRKLAELNDAADGGELAEARKALSRTVERLRDIQGDSPLLRIEVDPDVVAKVVSDWTGVPLGKVSRDQAGSILNLADNLKRRIRGQDHALDSVTQVLKEAKSGLKDPQQPLGVFLLVGPSGVGKTETALTVADLMFGGEHSCVSINMSEFQEKHTVSRLIGSPPGYVGYGEGGMLTEAVRQRPYSVVLFDEVEKAHPDIMNLFYQVFDKGVLSDGEGREIDFKNTVMFMTSNLASDVVTELCKVQSAPPVDSVRDAIRPILSNYFKPALLARMAVVPYLVLAPEAMNGIVRLKLDRLAARLAANHRMKLSYADAMVEQIAARCTEVDTGARNIDFILTGNVMPRLSQEILGRMGTGTLPAEVRLDVAEGGDFAIEFSG